MAHEYDAAVTHAADAVALFRQGLYDLERTLDDYREYRADHPSIPREELAVFVADRLPYLWRDAEEAVAELDGVAADDDSLVERMNEDAVSRREQVEEAYEEALDELQRLDRKVNRELHTTVLEHRGEADDGFEAPDLDVTETPSSEEYERE
ncbi:MAG: hypothetical protein SVU32_09700 [Candidatus Nanohaloarchaea archaeon]|nr:hypothetical protein [Candidatus Nanohaloarchaea archaeon]